MFFSRRVSDAAPAHAGRLRSSAKRRLHDAASFRLPPRPSRRAERCTDHFHITLSMMYDDFASFHFRHQLSRHFVIIDAIYFARHFDIFT